MGLSVNNFTFWSYLENNNKESWQDPLKEIKNDFSLFGYIIHDPQAKDGFGEFLGVRFDQLSRMTGTDFLFTAFVNPPENFDNSNKFKEVYPDAPIQIINSGHALKSDLSSFYAISISEYLGINTVSLPYIILTDDPTEKRFYFIELNKQNLLGVMSDLTDLAGRIKNGERHVDPNSFSENSEYENFKKKKYIKHNDFDNLIRSLDHSIYKIKLKQSLAQSLLKISYQLQKFALNEIEVKNILLEFEWEERVNQELREIQKLEFEGAQILYEYLQSTEGTLIKTSLLRNKEKFLRDLLELNEIEFEPFKNSIEPDTLSILLDGALLNNLYKEHAFSDASPFILPFGKAFEKEMTYSLVHWIRENLEIDLPEYFFKYQPEKEAILKKGRAFFNYNQLKPNSTVWQPPMIGGQVNGLELLSKEKTINPFQDQAMSKSFLRLGNQIMAIRNQASHLGLEGAASLRAIIHAWKSLWKEGYLEQLNRLKNNYRKV